MAMTALWEFGETGADAQALLPAPGVTGAEAAGGTLSVVFTQLLHIGPGDDTLAKFDDGASSLRFSVGEDGSARADLGKGAAVFSTQDGFFGAGDTLRATLVWDQGTGCARFVVENLTTGAQHESEAQPAPGLPDSVDTPDHWALPAGFEAPEATAFQGSISVIGFYDTPDDAEAIIGYGTPDAPDDVPEGETLDLDSEAEVARAALDLPEAQDGAEYTLSLRACDIADGGDSFRLFWNGEAVEIGGETQFFPPAEGFETYAFRVTGGSGDGANRLVVEGQGGDGGVAIAIEDVRVSAAEIETPDDDLVHVTIGIEGGFSDQASGLGAYIVVPATGTISQPQILFESTQSTLHGGTLEPGSTADFAVPQGAQIGLFVIGGGAMYNDFAALGPGSYVFLNAAGAPATLHDAEPSLYHVAPNGAQTLIDGPIFHAAGQGALNPDGLTHLEMLTQNDDGTQLFGFSDGFGTGGGARDLLVSVDPRGTGVEFLAPEGLSDAAYQDNVVPLFPEEPFDMDGLASPGLNALLPSRMEEPPHLGDALTDEDAPANAAPTQWPDMAQSQTADADMTFTETSETEASPAETASIEVPTEMSAELAAVVIVPCFTPGTLIDAAHGRVPVETLRPGDRVLTRDNGFQPIDWVGRKDVDADLMVRHPRFRGVRIKAGALGAGLPERDMVVSPQHRVLVIGPEAELMFGAHEVLVPAIHMVGMPGVEADTADVISYIHIMFRAHEIVRSDAMWTESFQPGDLSLAGLDTDQRLELLALFPELANHAGRQDYVSARRTLHRYETIALLAPRRPRRPQRRAEG